MKGYLKTILSTVLCYLMVISMIPLSSVTAFAAVSYTGSGTETDPFIVSTGAELISVFTNYNTEDVYIELDNNITLDETYVPGSFSGHFDGNFYKITAKTTFLSSNGGIIKNFFYTNTVAITETDGRTVGVLCNYNSGAISGVIASGSIGSGDISTSAGAAVAWEGAGIIAGKNSGTVINCGALGSVKVYDTDGSKATGIAGQGTVINCYVAAEVAAFGGSKYGSSNDTPISFGSVTNSYYNQDLYTAQTYGLTTNEMKTSNFVKLLNSNPVECDSKWVQDTSNKNSGYPILTRALGTTITSSKTNLLINGTESVTLTCSDTSAKIYYTLDGTNPTTASSLYSAPISITDDTVITVVAYKNGLYSLPRKFSYAKLSGDGTAESPYLINTEADLRGMTEIKKDTCNEAFYVLTNNIEMSEEMPHLGDFCGSFDGQGYTISNIYTSKLINGIFETNYGLIENLNLKIRDNNRFVSCTGIVSENYGVIYNCNVEGYLFCSAGNSFFGGIVAQNYGRVEKCSFDGSLYCLESSMAGGVVGYNKGEMTLCSFSGEVDIYSVYWYAAQELGFTNWQGYVGGFAGYNAGTITYSVVNATSVKSAAHDYTGVKVGPFVGDYSKSPSACSANVGTVSAGSGVLEWGVIETNAYCSGSGVIDPLPDVHDHDFLVSLKPPVCYELRYIAFDCSCGISFTTSRGYLDEYRDMQHDYSGVYPVVTKEPTCTEKGEMSRHCNNCSYVDVYEVLEISHGDTVLTDPSLYPESAHNYESNTDDTQTFTQPGATQLHITFSSETYTYYSDYIYIYYLNNAGSRVRYGSYMYDELRNKTITVPGDTVEIRLTSDSSNENYGYRIISIYADMSECGGCEKNIDSSLYPESSHNYVNNTNETKTFSYPGASELEVTFSSSTYVEQRYDYIYVYDGDNNQIGKYTGNELAGVTLTIPGDTFKVKLTSDGSYVYYGYSFTSINATVGYGEWTVEYAPTCTEKGLKAKICTICNERVTKELPALGHTRETIPAVSATCTETGLTSGTKCSVCQEILYSQGVIAAKGHNYIGVVTTEATCTQDGVRTYTCSSCSDSYTEVIPALNHNADKTITIDKSQYHYPESGHNYSNNTNQSKSFTYPGAVELILTFSTSTKLESNYDYIYLYDGNNNQVGKYTGTSLAGATITIPGDTFTIKLTSDSSTVYYGYSFTSIVAKESAGYGDWFVDVEAGCVEPGVEKRVCSICSYEDTKEIPATGHTHTPVTTDPTCTTAGRIVYTCHCGDTYSEVIVATGHNIEYYSVDSTSCVDIGYECYKCTVCGVEYGKTLYEPLDHTPGEWEVIVAATCTEDGYKIKKCTVCEIELEREDIAAKGHNHISEIVTEVTCLEDGLKRYICSDCADNYEEVLPATGHSYEEETIAEATCLEDGARRYTCTSCGDSYDEVLLATGHTETTIRTEPTCSADGSVQHLCEVCGDVLEETEFLPMIPHTYEESIIIEPTCVAEGTKRFTCSVCDDSYDDTIPATDEHTIMTIRKEPTCTKIGTEQCLCEVCGDMVGDLVILPKIDHVYGEWTVITVPTETEDGSKAHSCTSCGQNETSVIPSPDFVTDSGVAFDLTTRFVTGLNAGLSSLENYVSLDDDNYQWSYETQNGKLGTGSKVTLKYGESVISEYTILVYGDTNGDSWYDGQDAIIVDCLVSGMLTCEDVGEAVYMAADCNHDGVIDALDVALLNEAGTLLVNVDQSESAAVLLETSSAYVEYLDLIDQSPEIEVEDETDTEIDTDTDAEQEETTETDVDTTPEQDEIKAETSIFEMIINFIKSIFEMLFAYIPVPLK